MFSKFANEALGSVQISTPCDLENLPRFEFAKDVEAG
jgi:hypothetical protein